jgi:hypothetical protein
MKRKAKNGTSRDINYVYTGRRCRSHDDLFHCSQGAISATQTSTSTSKLQWFFENLPYFEVRTTYSTCKHQLLRTSPVFVLGVGRRY